MKNWKKLAIALAVTLTSSIYSSEAQIIVKVRPDRPRYERVVAPSPRHVWIDDDWEPRGSSYVFIGGRWADPPRAAATWVPGHWRERRHGWTWVPGHWK